jgi:hypothetical protein
MFVCLFVCLYMVVNCWLVDWLLSRFIVDFVLVGVRKGRVWSGYARTCLCTGYMFLLIERGYLCVICASSCFSIST